MQNYTAYIDVATMSMIFAGAAGVVVTIGTVIATALRKAKKSVNEKLGIDENRNKEVEADLTESFGEDSAK